MILFLCGLLIGFGFGWIGLAFMDMAKLGDYQNELVQLEREIKRWFEWTGEVSVFNDKLLDTTAEMLAWIDEKDAELDSALGYDGEWHNVVLELMREGKEIANAD